jgi:general secretion pathway protein G
MKRKHFITGAFVLYILAVIVATQVHLIYVDPEIKAQRATELMLSNLETPIQLYKLDTGCLPESLDHLLAAGGISNWHGPYLKDKVADDPWGRRIIYTPGSNNTFVLTSMGSDGINGLKTI